MKEAIQKAIKEGYEWHNSNDIRFNNSTQEWIVTGGNRYDVEILFWEKFILDPLFWQCLGRSLGYGKSSDGSDSISMKSYYGKLISSWLYDQHCFIDHLAEGKEPDLFFKELLK